MGTVVRGTKTGTGTTAFGPSTVAKSTEVNTDFNTIYSEFNGNIDNDNIKPAAGIIDTKLAQITTASKVHGSSITGLASVPAGAGAIPEANLTLTSKANIGANSDITSLSGLTTALSIAQGGTSMTTAALAINALLPDQAAANGQFLTSNGTVASWGDVENLSNVIFDWHGADSKSASSGIGFSSDTVGTGHSYNNLYFAVLGGIKSILSGRFTKLAGISTITIHARIWAADANATSEATLTANVGGVSNTVKSVTSATPTWVTTATLDVSGLVAGTVYDITISLQGEDGAVKVFCSGVTLVAS